MFNIKNNVLEMAVCEKAAEVHVLNKKGEDYNYIWCGEPAFWAGRNPILFPQVCSNSDKTLKISGIKYQTGNHGFARNQIFSLIDQKDDELTLGIKENEETLKQYPFKFSLTINYKLVNNTVELTYTIKNNDNKDMPFGFGLHPAFACKHDYDGVKCVFNKNEEEFGSELEINKALFEKYPTVIIREPKADKCTLITGIDNRKVSIDYPGYNIFAIWSKGDWVCLEPWFTRSPDDPEVDLFDQKGIIVLKPNEEKVIKTRWTIE